MPRRLSSEDELRLCGYYDAVDSHGRALISSSYGPMVTAIESGQVGARTVATSEPAHRHALGLLWLAREIDSVEKRLRAMPMRQRQVLLAAYVARRIPELDARYDRLGTVALLTASAQTAYKRAQKRQRINGTRYAVWLRKTVGGCRTLTGNAKELSEEIVKEADFLLTEAVSTWIEICKLTTPCSS